MGMCATVLRLHGQVMNTFMRVESLDGKMDPMGPLTHAFLAQRAISLRRTIAS